MISWRRLQRHTITNTPFLKVYEDEVELPNGSQTMYSVVELRSPVLVVATDVEGRVLLMREYRYAHDEVLLSLPAGVGDAGETPVETAKRELLEETGYASDDYTYIGEFYEYPTKLTHITHVVRARNITKQAEVTHEATEQIEAISLVPLDEVEKKIHDQEIKTAVIIAALYRTVLGTG